MAVSGVKIKTLPAVTVATAGTEQPAYSSNLMVYAALIVSLSTNTGTQYWGDSTVTSANGSPLAPDGSVNIEPPNRTISDQFNIKDIYLDSSTNGAEFRITVWIRE